MVESRWVRLIGPGVVALGALGFISATTLGAGARPWTPRACAGPPADLITAAREPGPTSPGGFPATPRFRVDPVIESGGALRGQRLWVGLGDLRAGRSMELPAESFAAGPFGRVILVGSEDGAASHLTAIDVANACAWPVGTEPSVIRRATVDPAGTGVYEMRVDRISRADLGIWWRPMDGGRPVRRILAPVAADGRFGRTYSTEFTWDVESDRLAVQSCGEAACRTRVISPRDGSVATLDAPDLGLLIGLSGDRVVTYGACRGLPCPVVSTDLRTLDRQTLSLASGPAVVVRTPDGPRLVHEDGTIAGRRLRSIALDGSTSSDLGPVPEGLGLSPSPIQPRATTPLPMGWVLLAPDGTPPSGDPTQGAQLRHLPDGQTVPLDEAPR